MFCLVRYHYNAGESFNHGCIACLEFQIKPSYDYQDALHAFIAHFELQIKPSYDYQGGLYWVFRVVYKTFTVFCALLMRLVVVLQ